MVHFILAACLVFAIGCQGHGTENRNLRDWGPYIVNGVPASPGEFPSQLSLQYFGDHNCGASIISAEWVMTAAHCLAQASVSSMKFLAGTNDLDTPGTYHPAEKVIIHQEYNPSNSWVNDIAVVKVSVPFDLSSPLTQPITLPTQGQLTADGSTATVIGWGRLSEGGAFPKLLQKADIAIVNQDECRKAFEDSGSNTVYPTQVCAGLPQGNVGNCDDDSGGPLFVNKVVVGLVSWGLACDNNGYPTVYTRVASYRNWIKENTGV